MNYRLVIFDFDGTLADSYGWFLSVFEDLSKRFQLPQVDADELRRLRAMDITQIMREYRIPFWKIMLIGKHLTQLMGSQIEHIRLVAGMQGVLDTLARHDVRLAIITSNAESNVRRVMGAENMAYFDFIESGVSMFGKKSKIHKLLKKTGVAAEQTLSIGDELRDLKSAHEAQVHFGAVSWGTTDLLTLRQHAPELAFEHPLEILQALNLCGA